MWRYAAEGEGMTDSMRSQLEQAYQLIQQDQLDEALRILRPITQQDPDSPDAWWLLANAVSEPEDAYEALTNVLRLEPGHAQAKELLDNLLTEFPELGSSTRPVPAMGADDDRKRSTDEWGEPLEAGSSLEDNIDEMFGERASKAAPQPAGSSDYRLETFFSSDSGEADDLDALFSSSGVKGVPAIPTEDRDLDALFGAKEGSKPARTGDPLSDPFGVSDPDFLDAAMAPPADSKRATGDSKRATGTARRTQTTTATTAAVPGQRQRSRAWLWLIPLLALLGVGAWWLLTNSPQYQVAVNATPGSTVATSPTLDATSQAISTAAVIAEMTATALGESAAATIAAVIPTATAMALSNETPTPKVAPPTSESGAAPTDSGGGGTDPLAELVSGTQDLFISKGFNNPVVSVTDNELLVSTCDVPSRTLQGRFLEAMQLVAQQAAGSRDAVQAVAVEIVHCNKPGVLYRASAAISAVIAFVDGGGTDVDTFRASWKD
jgi:hypothetical protein